MNDIVEYKRKLLEKLAAVDAILAEMGGGSKVGKVGRPAGRRVSAAAKKRMSDAAKERWKKKKEAK